MESIMHRSVSIGETSKTAESTTKSELLSQVSLREGITKDR
ncbi:MAG: hypothetical protein N2511_08255 [Thermodesulfovibrionales bacterium]|nr:hypothetical protein [Thermodesulfovibrionales bacterium]